MKNLIVIICISISGSISLGASSAAVADTLSCEAGLVGLGASLVFQKNYDSYQVHLKAEDADVTATVVVSMATSEGDVMEMQITEKRSGITEFKELPLLAPKTTETIVWDGEISGARTAYYMTCERK